MRAARRRRPTRRRLEFQNCNIRGWILAHGLALVVFVSQALAAVPGLCGDGYGHENKVVGVCPANYVESLNDSTKCYKLCPGGDKDLDGYASDVDCDDENKAIYPGQATTAGCTGAEVRTCGSNGQWSACAAFSCDATGSGTCKFFSPTGNNSTGDGSYGNPWLSLGKVSNWTNTPGYTLHTPVAGDRYYLLAGTYTGVENMVSDISGGVFRCQSRDGTSDNRIQIKTYPGAAVVIDMNNSDSNQKDAFYLLSCDYWDIEGVGAYLTIRDGYGRGITSYEQTGSEFRNISIINMDGVANDNHSAMFISTGTSVVIEGLFTGDTIDTITGGNDLNVTNFVAWRMAGLSMKAFSSYWTDATKDHIHWKVKHTNYDSSYLLENATFQNGWTAVSSGDSDIIIRDFRALDVNASTTPQAAIIIRDNGGTSFFRGDGLIENGTLKNSGGFLFTPNKQYDKDDPYTAAADACSSDASMAGIIEVTNVIIEDDRASYNVDSRVINLDPYGADYFHDEWFLGGEFSDVSRLNPNNNCYFNTQAAALSFGAYESNSFTVCGVDTNSGSTYTFAAWQSAGFDAGTYNEDPTLTDELVAESSNCVGRGFVFQDEPIESTPIQRKNAKTRFYFM